MENIDISIYCEDEHYSRALASYLANSGTCADVKLLLTEEEAADEARAGRILISDVPIKGRFILLSDSKQEAYGERPDEDGAGRGDSHGRPEDEETHFAVIYKYLPADILTDELLYQICAMNGRNKTGISPGRQKTRICAFIAAGGGTGNTALTICVARALCSGGDKALYISLEDIDSSAVYTGGALARQRTLTEYIYRVLSDNQAFSETGFTYKDTEGVRYFYEDESHNALRALTYDEMSAVLSHIIKEGAYDYVLADITGSLTPAARSVFDFASDVIYVSDACPKNIFKTERLKLLLSEAASEKGPFRTAEVYNRWQGCRDNADAGDADVFYVAGEEEAFYGSAVGTQISSYGEYARDIERIKEWIEWKRTCS